MRPIAFAFALLLPAAVQAATAEAPASAKTPPKPAAHAPLDELFYALAHAASPDDAKPIETEILLMFRQSNSASVELLMTRATAALQAADNDTARRLFESVTLIAPNYAEGWYSRAQLQAAANDDRGAMISLQRTIELNPRHFQALSDLAGMLEDYGDKAGALKLYRRAVALDPQMQGVARHIDALARDVEGQGI